MRETLYDIAAEAAFEPRDCQAGCATSTLLHPSDQHAMLFLTQLLYAVSLVAAKPVDPLATAQISQRVLQNHAPERLLEHSHPIHHTTAFDAAPNSVGLLLTSAGKQRVMHVWLPLGKRIETRKYAPQVSIFSPDIGAVRSNLNCNRRLDQPSLPSNFSADHHPYTKFA